MKEAVQVKGRSLPRRHMARTLVLLSTEAFLLSHALGPTKKTGARRGKKEGKKEGGRKTSHATSSPSEGNETYANPPCLLHFTRLGYHHFQPIASHPFDTGNRGQTKW
jgi:hypothetical protein